MKVMATILALTIMSSALVLAKTDDMTGQFKVTPQHSVILIGETTTAVDGTQNIEMEIVGLNPERRFEVTFKENDCSNAITEAAKSRSAIVTSSRNGTIVGFYSGKNGIGLSAIDIRPLENGNNICLDVNA